MNEDGTRTYTVTIYDDLKFSDGTPVTVKNYVVFPWCSPAPWAWLLPARIISLP